MYRAAIIGRCRNSLPRSSGRSTAGTRPRAGLRPASANRSSRTRATRATARSTPAPSCDDLGFRDLAACLPVHRELASPRHRRPAACCPPDELTRTVDIFPLEYSTILADYVVVRGRDPFTGLTIPVEDVRRAVEGAGQEPPDPPARGIPRVARRDDADRAADRRVGGAAARAARPHRAAARCRPRQRSRAPRPPTSRWPTLAETRMGVPGDASSATVLAASSPAATRRSPIPAHLLGSLHRRGAEDLGSTWTGGDRDQTVSKAKWSNANAGAGLGVRHWPFAICALTGLQRRRAARAAALTDTGQRLRQRHRRASRGRARRADPRAAARPPATSLVVATVPTFQPYGSIEEYAVKMFENGGRGIGDKGKDNGLLIVVGDERSQGQDRGRLRPRGDHPRRLRRTDDPRGDHAGVPRAASTAPGLLDATTRIINRIGEQRGVTIPTCRSTRRRRERSRGSRFPWVLLFWIIVDHHSVEPRQSAAAPALLGRRPVEQLDRRRRRRSAAADSAASGGSFGGGGGGFGGGGFGGFGGGSSGGGGASGSW